MRLIDADALKKKAQMRGHVFKNAMVTSYHMCVSTHDIDDAPTVDAEPVTRCQDCSCKKAVQIGRVMAWRCPYSTVDVDLDGFCHRGVKMDEDLGRS